MSCLALREVEEIESSESFDEIFKELAMDSDTFPADALEGHWI